MGPIERRIRKRRRQMFPPWEHNLVGQCWCNPTVTELDDGTITVHRDHVESMLLACFGNETPRVFYIDGAALVAH